MKTSELHYEKTKVCRKCQRILPLEAYSVNNFLKDGLQTVCRACDKLRRAGDRSMPCPVERREKIALKINQYMIEEYGRLNYYDAPDWQKRVFGY